MGGVVIQYFLLTHNNPYINTCVDRVINVFIRGKRENRIFIELIYFELKKLGLTNSGEDFSTKWLGREKSYYGVLKSKNRTVSAEALLNCARQLRKRSDLYARSKHAAAVNASHRLDKLALACLNELGVERV